MEIVKNAAPTSATEAKVDLLRYSDPDRLNLAYAAAVYLGKSDVENIRRPVSILKKRHALAIFRGEHVRFEFHASKVVYDHLITYTTADMRACAGLRANKATEFFMPPGAVEEDRRLLSQSAGEAFQDYDKLVAGGTQLQVARAVLPISVGLHFIFQYNFVTLITIFQQRIWTPGTQAETAQVVQQMWEIVHAQDPELWDAVKQVMGPESLAWEQVRAKLQKAEPEMLQELLTRFGGMKSMWD